MVCGRRDQKWEMLRMVWNAERSRIVLDQNGSAVGRGAYLHNLPECWRKIGEARNWEHAFRLKRGELSKESANDGLVELFTSLSRKI